MMRHLCIASEVEMEGCVSYLLLSDPAQSDFGLYLCDSIPASASALSKSEAEVVESGLQYPPALALLRKEASLEIISDRTVFLRWVLARLDYHLARQSEANYCLVKSVDSQDRDLSFGAYYWVLGVNEGKGMFNWVSRDFFIYSNPADSFDDPDRVFRHFRVERKTPYRLIPPNRNH